MRWVEAVLVSGLLAGQALGQGDYPARSVRIVVPSPPGGGTDIVARVLAQHFSRAFGQPFFVENKAGAGTMIGIESVARAAPDGYTLLMVPSTLALNSVLYKKVSYDPVRDFAPITLAASEIAGGVHRAGQGQAGAADLRHARYWHFAAHVDGVAEEHGGDRPAARSLPRHRRCDD